MVQTAELGPAKWDQFVGQERLKRRLQIHISAAYQAQRPLEHVLLAGPPGFGKSTLSRLITQELTDPLTTLVMPMSRRALTNALIEFQGGVLFIDEIHALSKRDQEILLPVLDERSAVINDRGTTFQIGWITVVAATTERDKLIGPLHDRFPIRPDFEPYSDEELGEIVSLMAEQADVTMTLSAAVALGRAAGGVPRQAKQFVFAARDLAAVADHEPSVEEILDLCVVDSDGLTGLHQQYLKVLDGQNGQAGEKTIESLLRVPPTVIREAERLLLQRGLVEYTPSGRQLTPAGRAKAKGRETNEYVRR